MFRLQAAGSPQSQEIRTKIQQKEISIEKMRNFNMGKIDFPASGFS